MFILMIPFLLEEVVAGPGLALGLFFDSSPVNPVIGRVELCWLELPPLRWGFEASVWYPVGEIILFVLLKGRRHALSPRVWV